VRNLLRLKAFGDFLQSHSNILEQQVQERTADLQRFRTAMDATADAIFLVNRSSMRSIEVNTAACNMLGYTREELFQMSPTQLDPTTLESLERTYDAIIAGHSTNELAEIKIRHKDGSELWVEVQRQAQRSGTDWIIVNMLRDITKRKQADDRLLESESRFKIMFDEAPLGIALIDSITGHFYSMNAMFAKITGRTVEEMTHIDWMSITHPDDVQEDLDNMVLLNSGKISRFQMEKRYLRPDGLFVWVNMTISPVYMENGVHSRHLCMVEDITKRKLAEDDLRIAAIAFESKEGMMVTDVNHVILRVNHAFTTITGYTAEDAIGQTPRLLSSGRHDADFYAAMWESIHSTGNWEGEVWNQRKIGEVYPEYLNITAVKGADGIVTNYVATLTDITLRRAAAEEIHHLAFYDHLTSLPNRRLLLDRLNHASAASARSGRQCALLYLDLDQFKTLNDTRGHEMGDLLLQQVAVRLTASVREGDTVARLGGDEFVVMLEDLSKQGNEAAAQAETIANKILTALNQPYQLVTYKYYGTVSIGVVLFSEHEQTQEELLRHADIAMYQAKKTGRNRLRFFDPQMQDTINARASMEDELRKALEKQQFHLYYQIQVDISGRSLGAEALIRWLHPERGLVSPFNFIPLAEETGLILPIGQWVLDTACAQLKVWQQDELTSALTLSVNVSAKQFHQADFVAQVQAAVQRHAINPMRLKLELTESMLLENVEDTIATMQVLKEIGIRFSLDDFGTGYSSLQYLKRLPLYQLKIDQSFVRDIAIHSSDQAIVRTIIAMAHTLNLNVIAEGVETEEQQGLLLNCGCTHYQGYLFGRPVPIEQFEALLKPVSMIGFSDSFVSVSHTPMCHAGETQHQGDFRKVVEGFNATL